MPTQYLAKPVQAPLPGIPPFSSIVEVRIIDTTTDIHISSNLLSNEDYAGLDELHIPSYSFLVSHEPRHILFDLGARKDLQTYAISAFT